LDDLLKFCGKVEVGEGRVGTCLLKHKAEVTEVCAAAMTETELKAVDDRSLHPRRPRRRAAWNIRVIPGFFETREGSHRD